APADLPVARRAGGVLAAGRPAGPLRRRPPPRQPFRECLPRDGTTDLAAGPRTLRRRGRTRRRSTQAGPGKRGKCAAGEEADTAEEGGRGSRSLRARIPVAPNGERSLGPSVVEPRAPVARVQPDQVEEIAGQGQRRLGRIARRPGHAPVGPPGPAAVG